MVVSAKQNTHKSQVYQGNGESACSSAEINAFTPHGLCDTRITAFGGLYPLIKFLSSQITSTGTTDKTSFVVKKFNKIRRIFPKNAI